MCLVCLQVLSVDYQNKKIILTRKKALMETTLPLLASYADARVGLVSHGFIVCIKDFGCIVRFFGDVKGLVPTSELTSEPTNNPQSLFYLGQVRNIDLGLSWPDNLIFIQASGNPRLCFKQVAFVRLALS